MAEPLAGEGWKHRGSLCRAGAVFHILKPSLQGLLTFYRVRDAASYVLVLRGS